MSRKRWRASSGCAIDREGFDAEMERQRERARASWKGAEKAQVAPVYQELLAQGRTKFLGYDDAGARSRGHRAADRSTSSCGRCAGGT